MQTSLSLSLFGEIIFLLKHEYPQGGLVISVYSFKKIFTKPLQIYILFTNKLGNLIFIFL